MVEIADPSIKTTTPENLDFCVATYEFKGAIADRGRSKLPCYQMDLKCNSCIFSYPETLGVPFGVNPKLVLGERIERVRQSICPLEDMYQSAIQKTIQSAVYPQTPVEKVTTRWKDLKDRILRSFQFEPILE